MTTSLLPDPWPPEARHGSVADRKAVCRSWVRDQRRQLREQGGEETRREHAARLREHATGWLTARRGGSLAGLVVTSYEPFPTEPDVGDLNASLLRAGATVLVPVTLGRDRQLEWSDLADPDRAHLGLPALARAEVVLLPALAVASTGVRLGQGGGYYDRLAPVLPPAAPRVAVLHDHELVRWLPTEPHDIVVSHVLTPEGVRELG
ncbi:5-formyltetrahydrofolate cyclo-ligase [Ornithinicoccus halotolerans]|uniref:5-formyltetrahydrofolate cyclo-ligase n=1 Tax=Ornithinicoccus halotolerans TaxID=1748220 RepID=UPI001885C105|nr:5-formyltetrahydrofolate cyclo-ligase [Ornithinicoccus halotolerans]